MICSWLGGWLISAVDLIDCVCFSLFLGFLVLVIVLVVSCCLVLFVICLLLCCFVLALFACYLVFSITVNGDVSCSNVLNNLDAGNPLHMNPNDSSSTSLIPSNLLECFLTNVVLSAQWDRCNAVVLTWIMNFVSSDAYIGLVYSIYAASVRKELESTYDKVDGSVIFNLLQKIGSIRQCGSYVADYYHRLNSLWREFDALIKLPTCTCDANKELSVRSALLTRDPLPEVKDAYTIVSREESYKGIPESSSVTKSKLNTTSFAAKSFNNIKRGNNSNNTRGEFEALNKLPTCTCDANKELGLHNQLMKLIQFPMSLDNCYESVRSALLTKGPFPKVKDAYTIVFREESYKGIPESFSMAESKLNATSFTAKSFNNIKRGNNSNNTRGPTNDNLNRGPNPNLICKNCGMIGHTIERCYELIDYPPGFEKWLILLSKLVVNGIIMQILVLKLMTSRSLLLVNLLLLLLSLLMR
ncbi:hypothetical protein Tco_0756816 [Tanacetum coccineum]